MRWSIKTVTVLTLGSGTVPWGNCGSLCERTVLREVRSQCLHPEGLTANRVEVGKGDEVVIVDVLAVAGGDDLLAYFILDIRVL